MKNYNYNQSYYPIDYYNNERFIGGGFAVPFLLGGLTGGLLAPAFNNNNNTYPVPIYQPYPVYQINQYPTVYY